MRSKLHITYTTRLHSHSHMVLVVCHIVSAHRKFSWLFRQNYNSNHSSLKPALTVCVCVFECLYVDGIIYSHATDVRRINNNKIKGDSGWEFAAIRHERWNEKNECVLIKIMAEEQKYINLKCKIIVTAATTKNEINTLSAQPEREREGGWKESAKHNNQNRCIRDRINRSKIVSPKDYYSVFCIV